MWDSSHYGETLQNDKNKFSSIFPSFWRAAMKIARKFEKKHVFAYNFCSRRSYKLILKCVTAPIMEKHYKTKKWVFVDFPSFWRAALKIARKFEKNTSVLMCPILFKIEN